MFEIWHWLFHDRRTETGPALAEYLRGKWDVSRSGTFEKERLRGVNNFGVREKRPIEAEIAGVEA